MDERRRTSERTADGLEPEPPRTSFLARWLGRSLEVAAYWLPVFVPLVVLGQIGALGLRPARFEERRLAVHQDELLQRRDGLRARRDELQLRLDAYEDPVYVERLERLERERRSEGR